jgi:uncharacterized protein Yka (UPF0111/DUF47 family)
MMSFQRILGREEEFCQLLEAAAKEGCEAVAALQRALAAPSAAPTLHEFAAARSQEKRMAEEISHRLVTTFVTPMEREDIEALTEALYKIPKTVEKFAQRYFAVADKVRDVDFSRQVSCMAKAVELVLRMVQALGQGRNLSRIKALQSELLQVEAEADDVLLELMQRFYEPGFPPLKAIILKDLFDLNEKVVDRCRDAGNVIARVILKNA